LSITLVVFKSKCFHNSLASLAMHSSLKRAAISFDYTLLRTAMSCQIGESVKDN